MALLDLINQPNDIKKIDPSQYQTLAKEIRRFLISKVSKTGGHLASNLGVVELTMALHLFLDLPKDKLIWDVGHQAYTHKLLTGRKDNFDTLRQFDGMSGFPKTSESACDSFDTGHSSTSISVADGIVKARDLLHEDYKVVAVIGDGALSGGMAYEALNNAGRFKSNMIIVLNDNNMSISENVGGMATYLGKIRTSTGYTGLKSGVEDSLKAIPFVGERIVKGIRNSKDSIKRLLIPGMFFENMGITYIGPIDGHNIPLMLNALSAAAQTKNPVLVHVITKKGKGYLPAELNPSAFHGVGPFDSETGETLSKSSGISYTEVFSEAMVELGAENKKLVAVTAAMSDGTGLNAFKEKYPDRFFDVGIAEEHAVTFAAGMASRGLHPVVAIYSTFLQRAYDQIIHDVALNHLPVTFAIDRAGIVGNDGETHQGIFDLSFLAHVPGMTVMAPKNADELKMMLRFATEYNGPVAIRYPRGKATQKLSEYTTPVLYGRSEVIRRGGEITLIGVGRMVKVLDEICGEIEEEDGIHLNLVNARFVNPIDTGMLDAFMKLSRYIITCEENVARGGFGEAVAAYLVQHGYRGGFKDLSLPDSYLVHGTPNQLRDSIGFDPISLKKTIKKLLTNSDFVL